MATVEARPQFDDSEQNPTEFRLPDEAVLKRKAIANHVGRNTMHALGYRIHSLTSKKVVFEPMQPGVRRYPPVRVQVPLDRDYVESYVRMGPTNWADILPKDTPFEI